MGLWQQMTAEQETSSEYIQPHSAHIQTGKKIIADAVREIIQIWDGVKPESAATAWDRIQASEHRLLIQRAEDRVNAIGSAGNRASLLMAGKAWVGAWRHGVAAWHQSRK